MNLLEVEWRQKLCPLEQVKKWKQGFSLKCPRFSEVCWCQDKDESILKHLRWKRGDLICQKCREEMIRFLSRFEPFLGVEGELNKREGLVKQREASPPV